MTENLEFQSKGLGQRWEKTQEKGTKNWEGRNWNVRQSNVIACNRRETVEPEFVVNVYDETIVHVQRNLVDKLLGATN